MSGMFIGAGTQKIWRIGIKDWLLVIKVVMTRSILMAYFPIGRFCLAPAPGILSISVLNYFNTTNTTNLLRCVMIAR